jgi:hypothetical protein
MESAPTVSIYVPNVGAESVSTPEILYQRNLGAIALKKFSGLSHLNFAT